MSDRSVYEGGEASGAQMAAEAERLRSFNVPTQASIRGLGNFAASGLVVDLGAGNQPFLYEYVTSRGGHYVGLDVRPDAVSDLASHDIPTVRADVRHLPIAPASADVVHARFVLAHLSEADRLDAIRAAWDTVKPGGLFVNIDYDWRAVDGSPAMRELRDFTLANVHKFDPAYGAKAGMEIRDIVQDNAYFTSLGQSGFIDSRQMFEYGPVLGLRPITSMTLEAQGDTRLVPEANGIFDALEAEAASDNPPGFYMPDMVIDRFFKRS